MERMAKIFRDIAGIIDKKEVRKCQKECTKKSIKGITRKIRK